MVCKSKTKCLKCNEEITNNNFSKHFDKCNGPKIYIGGLGRGGWNRGITLKSLLLENKITSEQYIYRIEASRRGARKDSTGVSCPYQKDQSARLEFP